MRADGRSPDELRPVRMESGFVDYPEGSILIDTGGTRVLCNASVEESQAPHLYDTGLGWVTAEYSMLPRSAHQRQIREVVRGRRKGRTHEIQRFVGRALRSVVDLKILGQRTVWIDCDVLQADGGTRTASLTGGYVAMVMAVRYLLEDGLIDENPVNEYLAGVSVGKVDDQIFLDLNYDEDTRAQVDMNLAMTESGEFAEIQASGEEYLFDREDLRTFLEFGNRGVSELIEMQKEILESLT